MEANAKDAVGWQKIRKRLFQMVSVGVTDDPINTGYDIVSTALLMVNIVVSLLMTYDALETKYGALFDGIEMVTIVFFTIDYGLRIITAKEKYQDKKAPAAAGRYMRSAAGIIDLLSFLPFYLPFFFPSGVAVFRVFRVVRIFRLFRLNAYYDSLNVITEVLQRKKMQLLSSVFIIFVLMIASSLCMYSLEHDAQPDVFENAFSGIWWGTSTLLTVGYGDIYPITTMGKIVGMIITFLGVGMVAIPTGIISAGFVEQYTRMKKLGDYEKEHEIHFITVELAETDEWVGKEIQHLGLPAESVIAAVQRGTETLIPRGNVRLESGDCIVIGAEAFFDDRITGEMNEVVLQAGHRWIGLQVKELDISRQTVIISIRRSGKSFVPKGKTRLREGDTIIMFTKKMRNNTFVVEPEED